MTSAGVRSSSTRTFRRRVSTGAPTESRNSAVGRTASVWTRALIEAGKPDGAVFNYDRITRTPNTRRAHRLVWWASHTGHNTDGLAERLFLAYFTEGRDLASCRRPRANRRYCGIWTQRAAAAFLDTAEGTNEIVAAEADAYRRGVHGVPDFRIGSISFSGAQPLEIMAEALRRAAAAV